MDILELTLLTVNDGIPQDSPDLLSALQQVRQKLRDHYGSGSHPSYSGSRFFVLSDSDSDSDSKESASKEIFILGIWVSVEAHLAFLKDKQKAEEVLKPQEGLTTFVWSAHLTSSWVLSNDPNVLSCEHPKSGFVLRRYSGVPRAARWFWEGLVRQCEETFGEVGIKARLEDEDESEEGLLTYFVFHAADLKGDEGSGEEVDAFVANIERGARMNGWGRECWRLRDMEAIARERES